MLWAVLCYAYPSSRPLVVLGVLLYGKWCFLASCGAFGERNYRNCEDLKRTLEELESFFLYSLFLNICIFLFWFSVIMISLFFFLLLVSKVFSLVYLLSTWGHFMLFMIFWLFIKTKNEYVIYHMDPYTTFYSI